ncbi:MAG: glycoside hydrolase family 57 protein [Vicinamibacterales bacterium]|nr:glycoside hydrolase family 57 protein [Vicinamibacterales bacterium]
MTNIALLWHMHQPYYEDLATGDHILPWVRMHALKDYYGMAALLREFPDMRLTFNLVPSLLVQLEAFAEERARDRHLELGLKPATSLSEGDKAAMLVEFFHAPRGRMIDPYPRYAELLQKREARGSFADRDYLDLQVWHKLAWVDPFYLDNDERVRALIAKQRDFDERDKRLLRDVELEILRRVIPEYREAASRGQAELSTSPFYHPILPLLCDTDVYLQTHPDAPVPRPPFRRPEDAAEQLARARACHTRLFGKPPAGVWPSEGSVSDAAAALAAAAGFRWMATDEAILGRTIGREFRRDGQGRLEQPDALYRPYEVRTGSRAIGCLFRDHALSDLIGFVYAGWDPEGAASDFVDRLVDSGRRFSAATGGEEATIAIILDGENAWEHFEGGGRPFLRALYGRLSSHSELRPVTMADAAARSPRPLEGVFPGSWIDGNFYIWIGHADDHRAWRQLREARKMFDRVAPSAGAAERERAFQEILIAEGSDWYWWYGDDHSSDHDLEFDDLFRRHLRNVYQMLGQPVPDELFGTNISTGGIPQPVRGPLGLSTPVMDGRVTSYFEWAGAGTVETVAPSGTMTSGEKTEPRVRTLLFGVDLERLYLRIDFGKRADVALSEGLRIRVNFTTPANRRMELSVQGQQPCAALYHRGAADSWREAPDTSCTLAAGDILEASVRFSDLGLGANSQFGFFVSVQAGSIELERHPVHRPIENSVPGPDFEKRNWKA